MADLVPISVTDRASGRRSAGDAGLDLFELVDLYTRVKALVLLAEELDKDLRSNVQVHKELRDAFDHLMRVHAYALGFRPNEGSDYAEKNLDKAVGHLLRAGFDALDGVGISLRQRIQNITDQYAPDVVSFIISDYYDKRIQIDSISEKFGAIRQQKDVGTGQKPLFDEYFGSIQELKGIHEYFASKQNALSLRAADVKREKKAETRSKIVYLVVGAVLGAILGTVFAGALAFATSPTPSVAAPAVTAQSR